MNISRITFVFLIAIAAVAICGTSFAQSVRGSAGAGWQTWNTNDLNDNGSPYWDVPFGGSDPNDEGYPAEKNPEFCMTIPATARELAVRSSPPGPCHIGGWPMIQ